MSDYIPIPPPNEEPIATWVKAVLRKTALIRLKGKDAYHVKIVIAPFPPEHYAYYQALQEAIAKLIPIEENRPTILLKIRGKNRAPQGKADSRVDYGYVGGTGPLSDAALLGLVVKDYAQNGGNLRDFVPICFLRLLPESIGVT